MGGTAGRGREWGHPRRTTSPSSRSRRADALRQQRKLARLSEQQQQATLIIVGGGRSQPPRNHACGSPAAATVTVTTPATVATRRYDSDGDQARDCQGRPRAPQISPAALNPACATWVPRWELLGMHSGYSVSTAWLRAALENGTPAPCPLTAPLPSFSLRPQRSQAPYGPPLPGPTPLVREEDRSIP